MSDLVLSRADLWAVGTTVVARAAGNAVVDAGATVDSAVVAADGSLTLTALVDGVRYVLSDGARRLEVRKASTFTAGPTWKARVAARRAALGTS